MRLISLSAVLPVALLALSACKSDYDVIPEPEHETIPLDTAAPAAGPVAVCSVDNDRVRPIHENTVFRGNESYDADGLEIVGWEWRLVESPSGSVAQIGAGVGAAGAALSDRTFTADMAGTYVAELTVMNEQFVMSEPCTVAIDAIPDGDLWVEMYWDATGEDMDLHLLRENAGYVSAGDCYYANCVGGLEWDQPGSADNPSLDLDDIPGMGPENINMSMPSSDYYTVVVHDYPGSSRTAATNVTVKVFLGGALMFEDTRSISGEDSYNHFARIDWLTQTVTPL
ncbi:MAG: hypothetical protein JXX28_12840 [Deltaproteobacteria bacterium]|nr:hypothetical protein [Deltaproteobacteria bacterium]